MARADVRWQDVPNGHAVKHAILFGDPAKATHWDGSGSAEAVIVQIIGEGPGTTTPVDPSKPFWMEVPH